MVQASQTECDVLVIGGGASGLAAALVSARQNAKTLALEKGRILGRKILASGNGRCNLTNLGASPANYSGGNGLASAVLSAFPPHEALNFFRELGVLCRLEEDSRVFPRCGKSSGVLTPLVCGLEEAGGKTVLSCEITSVLRRQGGFLARAADGREFKCSRLVLSCGSPAGPQLGGGFSGCELAKSLGHAITEITPALVPLCLKEKGIKRLSGIRFEAEVSIAGEGHKTAVSRGEVLFTDYGISGPAVLNVSWAAAQSLSRGKTVCRLNFFPEFSSRALEQTLVERRGSLRQRTLKTFFSGFIHETLANLLLDALGLDKAKEAGSLSPSEIRRISNQLSAWECEITSARPWSEAMAALGGVRADEVNPRTLESLKTPGLFITGELLEPVGESGGFNLHFAWATGFLAGKAAGARK